jgi:hypothetical protein
MRPGLAPMEAFEREAWSRVNCRATSVVLHLVCCNAALPLQCMVGFAGLHLCSTCVAHRQGRQAMRLLFMELAVRPACWLVTHYMYFSRSHCIMNAIHTYTPHSVINPTHSCMLLLAQPHASVGLHAACCAVQPHHANTLTSCCWISPYLSGPKPSGAKLLPYYAPY